MLKNTREVNVTNIVNGKKFSQRFQTEANMNAWIAKQEAIGMQGKGWGFGARTLKKEEPHNPDLVIQEFILIQDEVETPMVRLKAEYEIEILDIEQLVIDEEAAKEALAFLAKTDWYIVRLQETGKPVPEEILDQRAMARLKI